MLPSQHHASFSIALKRFMISLYARLMSFPHKINPLDYAMNQNSFNHVGLVNEADDAVRCRFWAPPNDYLVKPIPKKRRFYE
jgi:hypothetical protein